MFKSYKYRGYSCFGASHSICGEDINPSSAGAGVLEFGSSHSETVGFDPKVGDTVYVIWVEYSSGDSFGYGTRNNVEVVSVHINKEIALRNLRNLERSGPFKIEYENNKFIPYRKPWMGYFESLDEIHFEEAIIV